MGVYELLILLLIVALLFGTKKLRNMGDDLGSAVKSFRSAVKESEKQQQPDDNAEQVPQSNMIEGEVESKNEGASKN